MRRGLRLIVLGAMGRTPFAGVTWQVLHYLEGLRRLGHDVNYIEDTGAWPFDAEQNTVTADCRYTLEYIARAMARTGMPGRWAYVAASQNNQIFGPAASRVPELLHSADALINLTGATVLRECHMRVPVRIYLETDPVLPQIEIASGRQFTVDLLQAHTHHFTYAENIGHADCGVPATQFLYRATRQPIVLDHWADTTTPLNGHPLRFTTIANWRQTGKDAQWKGETYTWSKHHEFLKLLDLPERVPLQLELALACDDAQVLGMLREHGWLVTDAIRLSTEINTYREYILASWGEFTVAKDQNVRLRSGWFSDRSACYLAAGKPVITQDTGFGCTLPTREGLFAFRDGDEAIAAAEAIVAEYARHSRAARLLAHDYFRAEVVLSRLLAEANL